MPRTLRRHVEEAERIMSILGVRTLIPQKGRPAPKRVNADNEQLEYATDVRKIVEENDRTGYAGDFLRASGDVAGAFWHSIPVHSVCPLCLGRAPAERIGKGRIYCVACGAFIRPKNLRGLVSADIQTMIAALNSGKIRCRAERGERG
jgi:hypothetical protein